MQGSRYSYTQVTNFTLHSLAKPDARTGANQAAAPDTSVTPVGRTLAAFSITTPTPGQAPATLAGAGNHAAGPSAESALPLGQGPCASTVTLIPQITQLSANTQQPRRNRWDVPPPSLFNVPRGLPARRFGPPRRPYEGTLHVPAKRGNHHPSDSSSATSWDTTATITDSGSFENDSFANQSFE